MAYLQLLENVISKLICMVPTVPYLSSNISVLFVLSAYCENDEEVLGADSADVSVYPDIMGRAPLRGAGETLVESGSTIGFHIDGSLITVYSLKLWLEFADEVHIKLLASKDAHSAVYVSYVRNMNIYDRQTLHSVH